MRTVSEPRGHDTPCLAAALARAAEGWTGQPHAENGIYTALDAHVYSHFACAECCLHVNLCTCSEQSDSEGRERSRPQN